MTAHLDRLAVGSESELKEFKVDGKIQTQGGTWSRLGPGGTVSTARDPLEWEQALRGDLVLNEKQYGRATTPIKPKQPWGMGWQLSRTMRHAAL